MCEVTVCCGEAKRLLLQCLEETDSVKQSELLNKVGKLLCDASLFDELMKIPEWYTGCLNVLAEIFLACDTRNPSRNTLSRILDRLPQSCNEVAHGAISGVVLKRMSLSMDLILQEKDLPEKTDVEAISAMLGSFTLAMKFLGVCLNRQRKAARNEMSPSLRTSLMLDCLVTIKTMIALLQKCTTKQLFSEKDGIGQGKQTDSPKMVNQRQYSFVPEDPKEWRCTVKEIFSDLSLLLFDDKFLADCRSASGMAIPLLIKIICQVDNTLLLSTVTNVLFPLHATFNATHFSVPHQLEELIMIPDFHDMSNFAHLCICRGVLTMLPLHVLIQPLEGLVGDEGANTNLFFDVLFPNLCGLCGSLREASESLAAFRALALWTNHARQIAFSSVEKHAWIVPKLSGTSSISQKLLEYVWTFRDHPIEGVRYQMRAIFEDVVVTILTVCQSETLKESFLKDVSLSLVKEDWYVKGKYSQLCCITPVVGAKRLLGWYPRIPQDILPVIQDRSLLPHVMEFVEKVAVCHKEEILAAEGNIDEWFKVWLVPFLENVQQGCRQLVEHLTEFCLPKLLKCCPESLGFLLEHLRNYSESKSRILEALVPCLRTARSLGLLKTEKCAVKLQDKHTLWSGVVPVDLMRAALCHSNDKTRLDAFGLLCESSRTTESVTEMDLELLKLFVPPNMNNQSSSFRQKAGACLKKFLLRLKECIRITRKMIANEGMESQQVLYTEFLNWFCGNQFDSLYPGASFARRTTALSNLKLMKEIFTHCETQVSAAESKKLEFQFDIAMTSERVFVLLDCFRDTYDVNKAMAFDLLISIQPCQLPFRDENILKAWLQLAVRLVSSPRAVDSSSAAVLLRLLIERCHLPLTFRDLNSVPDQRKVEEIKVPFSFLSLDDSDVPCVQAFRVLNYLIGLLRLHTAAAIRDLSHASVQAPMHGVLYCLRAILEHTPYRDIADAATWQKLVSVLLIECYQTANIVAPVISSPSPEGHVIETSEVEGDWIEASFGRDDLLVAGTEMVPAAQALLVCCWRTMKEVALLIGELAQNAPVRLTISDYGLLTKDQFYSIGDFFTKILLTSKHRGAFELAYTGFVKLCSVLWRSPESSLRQLPEQWLQSLLQDINAATPSEVLCGTRRSAGLPFFVQAIVITEPPLAGKVCFKRLMKDLLRMASKADGETRVPDSTSPQVHAHNILRSLYRDTKLGEDVFPFVAEGVVAAVQGFQSNSWAVRNSSTLLFSALVTRIFGVKRSKDEYSRKDCMTGRKFFLRFPELHSFLLNHLQVACQAIESKTNVHPSLYPVLVLLCRLYPSSMDSVDSTLSMTSFLPHVISCRKSSVMKTRAMSSRALVPLVCVDSLVKTLQDFVLSLPLSFSKEQSCNEIHGLLLQIQNLLKSHVSDVTVGYQIKKQIVSNILPGLNRSAWLGERCNSCAVTRSVFLDIIHKYVVDWSWLSSPVCGSSQLLVLAQCHLQSLKQRFISMAVRETLSPLVQDACVTVGKVLVDGAVVRICLRACEEWLAASGLLVQCHPEDKRYSHQDQRVCALPLVPTVPLHAESNFPCFELMCTLLQSSEYEVRLAVLEFIINNFSSCKDVLRQVKIRSQLLSMAIKTEHHTDCLVKVFEVLCDLPGALEFPWTLHAREQIDLFQCWKFMVDLITKPDQRDILKSELLEFLSQMVPLMYSMDSVVTPLDDLSVVTLDTSSPTESVAVRLRTAQVLGQNTMYNVMADPNGILADLPLQLWSVVINLLQDDDMIVRERMAQGFSNFMQNINIVTHDSISLESSSLVAPLSTKRAMSCVWEIFSHTQPTACVQWILGWICGDVVCNNKEVLDDRSSNSSDVDRLFEKGSLNTYAEKCEVTSIAWTILKDGLQKSNGSPSLTLKEKDYFPFVKVLNETFENCLRFLESFCSKSTIVNGRVFEPLYRSIVGILSISFLKENSMIEGEDTETSSSPCHKATTSDNELGEMEITSSIMYGKRVSAVLNEIRNAKFYAEGAMFHPRVKESVLELCGEFRILDAGLDHE